MLPSRRLDPSTEMPERPGKLAERHNASDQREQARQQPKRTELTCCSKSHRCGRSCQTEPQRQAAGRARRATYSQPAVASTTATVPLSRSRTQDDEADGIIRTPPASAASTLTTRGTVTSFRNHRLNWEERGPLSFARESRTTTPRTTEDGDGRLTGEVSQRPEKRRTPGPPTRERKRKEREHR